MTECVVCGRAITVSGRGRPPKYCSRACRSRAYRRRLEQQRVSVATDPGTGVAASKDPGSADAPLTRDRIVRAAIALADAEGPAALSMRTLAARLGAGTMSLYRYVSGREELIDLMADAVFAERPLPPLPATEQVEWLARLELSARAELEIYRRHPWLPHVAALTARPPIGPHLMAYPDWRLRALDGLGLDFATMTQVTMLVSSFVQSVAFGFPAAADPDDRRGWLAARQPSIQASLQAADLPMVSRFGEQTFRATEPDAIFEFGLARLLDGVGLLIG